MDARVAQSSARRGPGLTPPTPPPRVPPNTPRRTVLEDTRRLPPPITYYVSRTFGPVIAGQPLCLFADSPSSRSSETSNLSGRTSPLRY